MRGDRSSRSVLVESAPGGEGVGVGGPGGGACAEFVVGEEGAVEEGADVGGVEFYADEDDFRIGAAATAVVVAITAAGGAGASRVTFGRRWVGSGM
ncbi:hypothetical protein ACQPXH_03810 [Nocardia sp. CA-135953]|uniref:hypothetical protein n=1 Tax=Nocardia sp. CA-135953 TaxID=3239978 RepID=UPI003D96DE84